MKIGDQIIVAKIKERDLAKQEFEKAKEDGKSASLLEESRHRSDATQKRRP